MNACIECQQPVIENQEGLLCEECDRWQHRECDSGVTRAEYLRGVENGYIEWSCRQCSENDQPMPDEIDVFAADLGQFVEPEVHQEVEMENPYPQPNPVAGNDDEGDEIQYVVEEGTSAKGKATLIDSLGYQYTKKVDRRRANTTWRCYRRTLALTCKATVLERDGVYTRGLHEHICGMMPGRGKVAVIRRKIKATALERPFDSAAEIRDTIMRDDIGVGQIALHPTLPKPSSLARQANLRRKLSRPRHPSNLQFELQNQHIAPGFLRDDVVIDGGRHVLFATDAMMDILGRARVWYLDGTFKLIRDPFYQLFSIHSFIRTGTSVKQVPLLFAVMSGKRSVDYTAVLRSVLRMLPENNVVKVVADYEASIWQSIRQVLPNVEIAGCLFHYTQAIFRKVQDVGLQRAYRQQAATRLFIRQLMALPTLPVEHVEAVFRRMRRNAGQSPQLQELLTYMDDYWINGDIYSPMDWVIFRQQIRTHRAKRANLHFYLLCKLLHEESEMVAINAELIFREDEIRRQSRHAVIATQRLNGYWDEYVRGARTARSLLLASSRVISRNARNP
ncbi:uncharacterized protein [Antedon mediterranea]|uniref:uncharacterized protein n=1 Tax=Antedon mediterranea TaxID=105859 RepID=UPI003AF4BEE0